MFKRNKVEDKYSAHPQCYNFARRSYAERNFNKDVFEVVEQTLALDRDKQALEDAAESFLQINENDLHNMKPDHKTNYYYQDMHIGYVNTFY